MVRYQTNVVRHQAAIRGGPISKSTVTTKIRKPADDVWARIRDYADLTWQPGVATCVVKGRVRTVTMHGMDMEVDEEEVLYDAAGRISAYSVIAMRGQTAFELPDGTVLDLSTMAGHHRASITVTPTGESTSLVTYVLELDDGFDHTLQASTGQYQYVIDSLRDELES